MTTPSPLRLIAVASLVLGCGACANPPDPEPAPPPPPPPILQDTAPVRARVTDLDAFAAFIATQPRADDFSARYPGVLLVRPGDITTKELRGDNSRYFADFDADGRITGGRFQ